MFLDSSGTFEIPVVVCLTGGDSMNEMSKEYIEKKEKYEYRMRSTEGKISLQERKKQNQEKEKQNQEKEKQKFRESLQINKLKFDFTNIPEDNLIMKYVSHQAKRSDAYHEYHLAGAIFILSTITDRRVSAEFAQTTIYPNIWCMCLGASSISRKSTAVGNIESLMNDIEMQENVLPGSFSPESFIEILSDNEHGYLLLDEAGALLANMQKTYMQEMRDVFSKLYDNTGQCRQLRSSQKTGKNKFKVESPFITQLYATTPSNFAAYTNELDVQSGYLLRFLYLNPSYQKDFKPFEMRTPDLDNEYGVLKTDFEKIRTFIINHEIKFIPNDEALKLYQEWQQTTEQQYFQNNADEITLSAYGRLNIYALKLAMIYQIADANFINNIDLEFESKPYVQEYDDAKECYISAEYMQLAIKHVEEYFLPSFVDVAGLVIKTKTNNLMDKIINYLVNNGGKCKRTEIMQKLHISKFDLDNNIESLKESEEIIENKEKAKNGKMVCIYSLNKTE